MCARRRSPRLLCGPRIGDPHASALISLRGRHLRARRRGARSRRRPPLTVPKAKLDAALHCHGKLQGARRRPIMLVTGTGATGDEAYRLRRATSDGCSARAG
jgi:hypothetical protein